MFGYSYYLSSYRQHLPAPGSTVPLIFTSLHISEEYGSDFLPRATAMLAALRGLGGRIIADVSPKALAAFHVASLAEFAQKTGVDILRCDYGFTREEIFEAARHLPIACNASTGDAELAIALAQSGAEVYAIHNFYPRPETGLDLAYFRARTAALQQAGVRVLAFIAGDGARRGPIFAGLPTLEAHRTLPPYVQYAQLMAEKLDGVLLGDLALSPAQQALIDETERTGLLALPAQLEEPWAALYGRSFTVRPDSPETLARFQESREYSCFGSHIAPTAPLPCPCGSITVDNEQYLRYSGEVQLTKADYPADARVNVVGHLLPEYHGLLQVLGRGCRFRLVRG
ncbi:MAG: MupG family TIM beta-alpha barrel fold protein [Gemmiger sp.]|nr:MupG family TIM beta-alpha barrel fold protein [Gemmiger sp.]